MLTILLILSLLACVLLVAIVLIQNPKGGGLASNFSASSQMLGVQKTGDFLEKGTWGLAIFLMVMALAINVAVKGSSGASTGGSDRVDHSTGLKGTPAATAPNYGTSSGTPSTGSAKPAAPAQQNPAPKK